MALHLSFILWLWQDDSNWLWRFWVGESYGIDWLYLFVGTLFIGAIGYGIYSAMLHSLIAANWHPSNFRKLIWALCFLLWIFLFTWIFAHVFGGFMLYFLSLVWLVAGIIFFATRRKVSAS